MAIDSDTLNRLCIDALLTHQNQADNVEFGSASDWTCVIQDSASLRYMGRCCFESKQIIINVNHVQHTTDDELVDTLMHECAHALAGYHRGANGRWVIHGPLWRKWASRLGARPRSW